jgi:GDP-mannose pyrophosphatase NudK
MSNKNVRITGSETLSDNRYKLSKVFFDYHRSNGKWQAQAREVYNRGDGAAVLMIDRVRQKVLLTRQFRLPTYLNGLMDGLMLEVCAGVVEAGENPYDTMMREIEEETGYRIQGMRKLFETYMSPASVTEKIHFFVAEYTPEQKKSAGGGEEEEQEDIEVLEYSFKEIHALLDQRQVIDAKTLILLQHGKINGLFD